MAQSLRVGALDQLGLRAIYWQLAHAKTDDQLREVVARMWDMAVHLEDGSVSDAEQALGAAEEALRQALERGADDEEIKKLTEQLRAALDTFLQAMAEQLRRPAWSPGTRARAAGNGPARPSLARPGLWGRCDRKGVELELRAETLPEAAPQLFQNAACTLHVDFTRIAFQPSPPLFDNSSLRWLEINT
jgi:hypothetical protein